MDAHGAVHLSDLRATHLRRVLHATPGQAVRIGLIDGPFGEGIVTDVVEERVSLRCTFDATPPSRPAIDLLLAVPRPKVLRRLWPQLAALGVGRVILTNAARVERNYFDTHFLQPAIVRPLLLEGLQQARDTRVPQVSIHRQFKVLVEDHLDGLCPEELRLVAHPGEAPPVAEAARLAASGRVLLAVGPEGGWTDYELALLLAHGFRQASMGARTLRTDTACVALLALAHNGKLHA